jgi:hypothetical protein
MRINGDQVIDVLERGDGRLGCKPFSVDECNQINRACDAFLRSRGIRTEKFNAFENWSAKKPKTTFAQGITGGHTNGAGGLLRRADSLPYAGRPNAEAGEKSSPDHYTFGRPLFP